MVVLQYIPLIRKRWGNMFDYNDEEQEEKKFWNKMGKNCGYIDKYCPNCGRHRVEHWSCGKDICEKCHWDLNENKYFVHPRFSY